MNANPGELLEQYENLENVDCALVGDIPVICFDSCQSFETMPVDKSLLVESNITALRNIGAVDIDGAADSVAGLTPEMLPHNASVFIFSGNNGATMAACRLDRDDTLARVYKTLHDISPVIDEEAHAKLCDDFLEDNKDEIMRELVRLVFEKNPELDERFSEEVNADSKEALEAVWPTLKSYMGIESSGWFVNDEAGALTLSTDALQVHLDEIATCRYDMSLR